MNKVVIKKLNSFNKVDTLTQVDISYILPLFLIIGRSTFDEKSQTTYNLEWRE